MIKTKVLISAFLGTLMYTSLSLVAGSNGFFAYNQLEQQKIEIAQHTDKIQNINSELNLEYTGLLKDKDVISSYARKLDYVAKDEKLVKINGLSHKEKALYDTGNVIKRKPVSYFSETTCKACALVVFCLSFIIGILVELSHGTLFPKKNTKEFVQGIPVYDLQQV